MSTHLLRLIVALLLAVPALLIASPASACACGGIASNDPAAQVSQETAIVSMAGRRETIDMRLSMRSVRSDAALIVPTPAPATVSEAKTRMNWDSPPRNSHVARMRNLRGATRCNSARSTSPPSPAVT